MSHERFEELAALAALDALDGEDAAEWQRHAAACASCREQERALREAASLLALGLDPVAPRSEIRDRVLANLPEKRSRQPEPGATVPRRIRASTWWLAAAASLLAVLFAWSQSRLRAIEERLGAMQQAQQTITDQNRKLAGQNAGLAEQIAAIAAAETRTIALSGQEVAPSASARVFLDERKRRAFVFFDNLPENASDKSYQLWIIRADKAEPESAGVFDVSDEGRAQIVVENLPVGVEIKALAVTLEPKGGVPAPTGDMFLIGSPGT